MALGMKLRVFFIGPFQWDKHRGKWRFRFLAKEILGAGIAGKAGLIPTDLERLLPNELLGIDFGYTFGYRRQFAPIAANYTKLQVGSGLASSLVTLNFPYLS
jgi:hypothetical protein